MIKLGLCKLKPRDFPNDLTVWFFIYRYILWKWIGILVQIERNPILVIGYKIERFIGRKTFLLNNYLNRVKRWYISHKKDYIESVSLRGIIMDGKKYIVLGVFRKYSSPCIHLFKSPLDKTGEIIEINTN
jgi:hypothetical protein